MLYNKFHDIARVIQQAKLAIFLSSRGETLDPEDLYLQLNALAKFDKDASPFTFPKRVFPNKLVDANILADFFSNSKLDLEILFAAISNLETELATYTENSQTDSESLNGLMHELLSKLGNLRIFGAGKHRGFSSSSFEFKDLKEALDGNCFIDSYGSVLTLGWDGEPDIISNAEIKIANGTTGQLLRGSLNAIMTNNPTENVEIYRDVRGSQQEALDLILDFQFSEIKIINNLILETSIPEEGSPKIISLALSADGSTWVDGLEYFNRNNKLDSDALNLGLSDNFLPGTRSIHFPAQKVLFARLHLRQTNSQAFGDIQRFIITLKKCLFRGIKYQDSSEFISNPISDDSGIVKVGILSDQLNGIFESPITHFVSGDEQAWISIDPVYIDSTDAPDLLTFNLGTEGSIQTENPITNLYYKAQLKKGNQLSRTQTVANITLSKTEAFSPNLLNPKISLAEVPIKGSLSVSHSLPFTIGGTGIQLRDLSGEDNDLIVYKLPLRIQPGQEEVYMSNRKWLKVDDISTNYSQNNGLVYQLDYDSGTIIFSKRVNENGELVARYPKTAVEITLKPEVAELEDSTTLKLINATNGDINSTRIYRLSQVVNQAVEDLPVSQRIINLQYDRIISPLLIDQAFGENLVGPRIMLNNAAWSGTETPFLDGTSEFILYPSAGYSLDYSKGILYLKEGLSSAGYSIYYPYLGRELLANWEFGASLDTIKLRNNFSGFATKAISLNATLSKVLLPKYLGSIKKNSAKIVGLLEIPFKNGKREFKETGLSLVEQNTLFSIDYSKNKIYFQSEFTGGIKFEYAGFEVEYIPMYTLRAEDYAQTKTDIEISRGFLTNLNLAGQKEGTSYTVQVNYKYVPKDDSEIQSLKLFETPIIFVSSIVTLNQNQLLGIL